MPKSLNRFERQLCDIQGRLFELSLVKNLDSIDFIEKFMNSITCEFLDMPYDRLQWAGEEYILENLQDEIFVKAADKVFGKEELFWVGYVYRYWHLLTGESSRDIYMQSGATQMKDCYLGFHALDVTMAIDNLKEIKRQRNAADLPL